MEDAGGGGEDDGSTSHWNIASEAATSEGAHRHAHPRAADGATKDEVSASDGAYRTHGAARESSSCCSGAQIAATADEDTSVFAGTTFTEPPEEVQGIGGVRDRSQGKGCGEKGGNTADARAGRRGTGKGETSAFSDDFEIIVQSKLARGDGEITASRICASGAKHQAGGPRGSEPPGHASATTSC